MCYGNTCGSAADGGACDEKLKNQGEKQSMGMHFLSVLGTSLYEPVVYHFPGKEQEEKEQEFVQTALIQSYKEQLLNDGRISILLTDGARSRNWEDRLYDAKDVKFSRLWTSEKKQAVQEGQMKSGMWQLLQKEEPRLAEKVTGVSIPDAKTEEEIWSVFETLYGQIGEGDEIVFDITHSFRSIPLLAVTIMNYAKVLKNCTLKGIYYGAFEAAQVKDGVKYAPVIDLTVYNEIMDWTNAAEAFMKYGIAAKMKQVYEEKMDRMCKENDPAAFGRQKKLWAPVSRKIDAMQNLAECIYTNRGTDAKKLQVKKMYYKRSIRNAYTYLTDISMEHADHLAREIKPLYPLMEKIEDRYRNYFQKEKNYETGCGVVQWSIDNHMIQQGYTALEETIKTYLCDRYGVDDRTESTRDGIFGRIITGISRYMQTNDLSGQEFEKLRMREPERICSAIRIDIDIHILEKYCIDIARIDEIIRTISVPLAELGIRVKALRNDISHMGFRLDPKTAEELGSLLKENYEIFTGLITEEDYDMSRRYLTILEVSQKQAYIFQSNELGSNVLNSAVIAWIMSGEYLEETIHDKEAFRISRHLVYAGGGHTVLEFETYDQAEAFTRQITWTIHRDYPEIEMFAVTAGYDDNLPPGENLKNLTKELERKKSIRLSSFHQGSFGVENMNVNTKKPMLEGELQEQNYYQQMPKKEIRTEEMLLPEGFKPARRFQDLGGSKDRSNFIAVVHIDGNAMGRRVESLQQSRGQGTWEAYKEAIRKFSDSVDSQFKEAYKEMAEYVAQNVRDGRLKELELCENYLPVRRMITAGDDVCFVCEGRIGLECAVAFLRALWKKNNAEDNENYAACAGVAIVHQKYPFYKAYEMAEMLCSNAKKYGASLGGDGTGRDVSVIDWHIGFGEMKDTLEEIRQAYVDADGNSLLQRPYIVEASAQIQKAQPAGQYQDFRELLLQIRQKENYARGKLKELRTVLKQGGRETEYFLRFHKIRKLLMEQTDGRFPLLFDAIEMMDTFLPLEGEEAH